MTGNDVRDEWRAPLDDLRTLRESLREEEQRVSYWRQLVQGRLDLVRTALEGGHPSADDLASLAAARPRLRTPGSRERRFTWNTMRRVAPVLSQTLRITPVWR